VTVAEAIDPSFVGKHVTGTARPAGDAVLLTQVRFD
jgi:hypothetical protein